jgi:DegV family protein with EDD domain
LSPELARELGVTVVPLQVIFGDDAYREGIDITADEFYERLASSRSLPTTSAPSVGAFQEAYEGLLGKGDSIVSVHLSGKLSATVRSAQAAAEAMGETDRIAVVDSQSVSLGMGFAVQEAVEAVRAGAKLDKVKAAAENAVPRIHVVVMVDTLENLRRGGRIGRARAYMGTLLRIKPVLAIRDGEVYPQERVRTRARALERIIQTAAGFQNVKRAAVAYTTTPDEAERLRERLAMAFPHIDVKLERVGPVLGTHGGFGVIGVGVMEGE